MTCGAVRPQRASGVDVLVGVVRAVARGVVVGVVVAGLVAVVGAGLVVLAAVLTVVGLLAAVVAAVALVLVAVLGAVVVRAVAVALVGVTRAGLVATATVVTLVTGLVLVGVVLVAAGAVVVLARLLVVVAVVLAALVVVTALVRVVVRRRRAGEALAVPRAVLAVRLRGGLGLAVARVVLAVLAVLHRRVDLRRAGLALPVVVHAVLAVRRGRGEALAVGVHTVLAHGLRLGLALAVLVLAVLAVDHRRRVHHRGLHDGRLGLALAVRVLPVVALRLGLGQALPVLRPVLAVGLGVVRDRLGLAVARRRDAVLAVRLVRTRVRDARCRRRLADDRLVDDDLLVGHLRRADDRDRPVDVTQGCVDRSVGVVLLLVRVPELHLELLELQACRLAASLVGLEVRAHGDDLVRDRLDVQLGLVERRVGVGEVLLRHQECGLALLHPGVRDLRGLGLLGGEGLGLLLGRGLLGSSSLGVRGLLRGGGLLRGAQGLGPRGRGLGRLRHLDGLGRPGHLHRGGGPGNLDCHRRCGPRRDRGGLGGGRRGGGRGGCRGRRARARRLAGRAGDRRRCTAPRTLPHGEDAEEQGSDDQQHPDHHTAARAATGGAGRPGVGPAGGVPTGRSLGDRLGPAGQRCGRAGSARAVGGIGVVRSPRRGDGSGHGSPQSGLSASAREP